MGGGCSCSKASPIRVYQPKKRDSPSDTAKGGEAVSDTCETKSQPGQHAGDEKILLPEHSISTPEPGHGHFLFWVDSACVSQFAARETPYSDLVLAAGAEGSSLPQSVQTSISNDIPRTFFIGQPPLETWEAESLTRILRALAFWDQDLAYCQGLNYISAFVLRAASVAESGGGVGATLNDVATRCKEEEAFWLVACLMRQYRARGFFLDQTPLLKLYGFCVGKLLQRHLPALHTMLQGLEEVLCYKWLGTLFTTVLPPEVALRAWDVVFHHGLVALFRLALGLFLLLAPALLVAESNGEEAVEALGPLQRQLATDPAPLLQPLGPESTLSGSVAFIDALLVQDGTAQDIAGRRWIAASESFKFNHDEFEVILLAFRRERWQEAAGLDGAFSFSDLTVSSMLE